MSVYLIIEIEVLDEEVYSSYMAKVPVTVKKYGGQYLARTNSVVALGGDWKPERIIIIRFPSLDKIEKWLSSEEYAQLAPIRMRSTKGRSIVVPGLPDHETD